MRRVLRGLSHASSIKLRSLVSFGMVWVEINCSSFCSDCLTSMVQANSVRCPSCRTLTRLPVLQISGLPINYSITKIQELVTLPNTPSDTSCQRHEEEMRFWCDTCAEMLCCECVFDKDGGGNESHKTHQLSSIKAASSNISNQLHTCVDNAQSALVRLIAQAEELQKSRETMTNNVVSEKSRVNDYFEMLADMMHERRKVLLSQVDSRALDDFQLIEETQTQLKNKTNNLHNHLHNIQALIANPTRSTRDSVKLITDGSDLLQSAKQAIDTELLQCTAAAIQFQAPTFEHQHSFKILLDTMGEIKIVNEGDIFLQIFIKGFWRMQRGFHF